MSKTRVINWNYTYFEGRETVELVGKLKGMERDYVKYKKTHIPQT
jgi:hypothetical protein